MSEERINYAPGGIPAALENGAALLEPQPAAAALQARTILQTAPQNTAALRLLARALERLGESEQARQARARAIALTAREPDVAAAHKALNEERLDEVAQILRARLSAEPDEPVALLLMSEAKARASRFAAAAEHLRRALEFAPEYTPARMALARSLYRRFEPREALAVLDSAPASGADDTARQRFRATLMAEIGDYSASETVLRGLAETHPDEAALHLQHGDMLRSMGQKPAAVAAYRKAISASPDLGRAWWALAALDPDLLDVAEGERLEALYRAALDPDNRMHLAFALGRLKDRQRSYASAFALFTEANALHRKLRPWDARPFLRRNAALIEALDTGLLAQHSSMAADKDTPIFIVGLARSGSTLIEQMLSRHSQIAAGGELPAITALLREFAAERRLDPDADVVALLRGMTRDEAAELGAEYLRRARQRCTGPKAYFIDKLPHNWAELAFIRKILPRARVIDMRRNLADCAVSNFALLFSPGHPASYELNDFAAYARAYLGGIAAFARNTPDVLLTVQYEQLVASPETVLRAVLAHLDLPFEAACLNFSESDRAVATASAEQVRRPLSVDAIGTWQRFAPWLGSVPGELKLIAGD